MSQTCKAGGFHLTKFISNSKKLLLSIPESQRKIDVKDQDLSGQLPNEKALGICWVTDNDAFTFKIKLDERPLTERVMLSVISSIYNSLCFAAPFVLEERRILQSLCEQMCIGMLRFAIMCSKAGINGNGSWSRLNSSVCKGASNLLILSEVSSSSLHHFSDTSQLGYGQCSYIKMVSKEGKIHCCLLLGNARVVPNKFVSILR